MVPNALTASVSMSVLQSVVTAYEKFDALFQLIFGRFHFLVRTNITIAPRVASRDVRSCQDKCAVIAENRRRGGKSGGSKSTLKDGAREVCNTKLSQPFKTVRAQ